MLSGGNPASKPAGDPLLAWWRYDRGVSMAPTPVDALRPAETSVPRTVRLWPWLICAVVVLFVLDAALRRVRSL